MRTTGTMAAAAAAALLIGSLAFAAEPWLHKQDLFLAQTEGYTLYRIPGVVVTSSGAVLAYCEARRNGNDWDEIDIMLRRSVDGGQTWDSPRKIARVDGPLQQNPVSLPRHAKPGQITYNNPVAIVDRQHPTVHFLFCIEYMRCFYMRSDDDGRSFSRPVEITQAFEAFRPEYDWRVLATGPGHGVQLRSGRLVVPVWLSSGTGGGAHRPSVASVIYSDDQGQSWNRGEIAVPNTDEWVNPSETLIVQLADGRVMLNARNESKAHRRLITYSQDGATGWSAPRFHPQLLEPICMASLVRLTARPEHDRNRILFANPDTLESRDPAKPAADGQSRARKNVSIKLSYDEGETWPVSKTLEPGFSGYSDLAAGRDGVIYCFYERGSVDGKNVYRTGALCLTRLNLEWLTDGRDTLKLAE